MNLRPSAFPVTIRYFRTDTGELVHSQIVEGPGAVYIEPWARIVGSPIQVEVEFADGETLRIGK